MADWIAHFRSALRATKVSHVWRGYGSALFLEFGNLSPAGVRGDGRPGESAGEIGLMIEWSWRIEDQTSILCGSWSEERLWRPALDRLLGRDVLDLTTFGRLPELQLALSDGLYVASFMTAEGDPAWTLFDRRAPKLLAIECRSGVVARSDP